MMIARTQDTERSARWVLAGLSTSMLVAAFSTSSANIALPALALAFEASFPQVQWVVLAYLLAVTTLIVAAGRLGDIHGRRKLFLAGTALFTAASLACGVAPSLGLLIAARVVQGIGAAFLMALTMAFVGDAVPKSRVGRAMGLLGTMSALGTALGPSLGGALIAGLGWRAVFFANVPLGLVTLLLAWRHLPVDGGGAARERIDVAGILLLAATLAAYALAMTGNMLLLLAAVAGAGLFVRAEAKAAAPLIRLETFRDRALGVGLVMNAVVATVMMATLVVGPFYLSRALGLDPARVGLAVAVGPVVVVLAGMPAGRLADRFGARRMTIGGLAGLLAGLVALAAMPTGFGIPGYVGAMVVVTTGYALFHIANNAAVMAGIPQDRRGGISGMLNLSRNLGLITGTAAMGAVFTLAVGSADVATAAAAAVATGMRITFAVAALLVGAALALSAVARE